MRSLLAAVLVASGIGIYAQTQASRPSTSVSGVVRDAASRRPISGARVSIMSEGEGPGTSTTTGDDGKFVLENIVPGAYSIVVIKPPYANGFFPDSTSIRVEGRPIDGLDFALVPGAVITGQVIDSFGQPAPGVDVNIRRVGSPRLQYLFAGPLGHYQTDADGKFRYFALAAGDYLISAEALVHADRLGSNDGKPISSTKIYFPGVLDPSQAQLVTVSPGEERTGVDFRLLLTGLAKVAGVLTGPPEALKRFAMIHIRAVRPEVAEAMPYIAFASTSGSDFVLSSIPPGRYWLTARVDPPVNWSDPVGPRENGNAYWAATEIVVGDNDVSGITLALQATTTVSGRVSPAGRVQVSLRPTERTPIIFDGVTAMTDADGVFSVPKVPPGQYRIVVRDERVTSVIVGNAPMTEGIVTVPPDGLKDVVVIRQSTIGPRTKDLASFYARTQDLANRGLLRPV